MIGFCPVCGMQFLILHERIRYHTYVVEERALPCSGSYQVPAEPSRPGDWVK